MLIIFSESVDYFPIDFFVDVILEVLNFFGSESCADSAERASENCQFFFFFVAAFFARHCFVRKCRFKSIMM